MQRWRSSVMFLFVRDTAPPCSNTSSLARRYRRKDAVSQRNPGASPPVPATGEPRLTIDSLLPAKLMADGRTAGLDLLSRFVQLHVVLPKLGVSKCSAGSVSIEELQGTSTDNWKSLAFVGEWEPWLSRDIQPLTRASCHRSITGRVTFSHFSVVSKETPAIFRQIAFPSPRLS